MAVQHIEYLVVDELPRQPVLDGDGLSGWRVRRLRGDDAGGAYLADVAPCWMRRQAWSCPSTTELLVLAGSLDVGGERLIGGDYLRVHAGGTIPPLASADGATLFVTHDAAAPAAVEADAAGDGAAPLIQHAAESAWHAVPSYAGRSIEDTVPGMDMRTLREGGADEPYTFLVRCPGGWADPREESHDTWEELFLLHGDYLMGDFGRLCAGSYIFRPGIVPHGPQATFGGSTFLARGEKRIDFCFRPLDHADAAIAAYRERSATLPPAPRWIDWL